MHGSGQVGFVTCVTHSQSGSECSIRSTSTHKLSDFSWVSTSLMDMCKSTFKVGGVNGPLRSAKRQSSDMAYIRRSNNVHTLRFKVSDRRFPLNIILSQSLSIPCLVGRTRNLSRVTSLRLRYTFFKLCVIMVTMTSLLLPRVHDRVLDGP